MEHIEHPERHNQAMRTVEQSIGRLELNQLIKFTSREVQLFERLKQEHPDKPSKLFMLEEAPSVTSLVFSHNTTVHALIEPVEPVAQDKIRSRLMRPQEVIDAAAQSLETRSSNLEQIIPCISCSRISAPTVHCPFCKGIGSVQRHPRIRLFSQLANKYTDLTLDVPMMLSTGELTPEWDMQTSSVGHQVSTIGSLGIAMTPLVESAARRLLDVDTKNSAIVTEADYVDDIASRTPRALGLSMTYDHTSDSIGQSTRRSTRKERTTPESVLRNLEMDVIRKYNAGRTIQPDGTELAGPPLTLRPLRDTQEALDDLIVATESIGGALWAYWQYYSETEQGIEFAIVLPQPDQKDILLSCEPNIRLAIENSWVALQRITRGRG